jgi:hypothetical protein
MDLLKKQMESLLSADYADDFMIQNNASLNFKRFLRSSVDEMIISLLSE